MNRLIFIIIFFLSFLKAGESIWVKYGNQVYEGVGDARAIALSGAEVASATGPLAILWNPARLFESEEKVLCYAHQERFAGVVKFDIIGTNLKNNFKSKWSLVFIREEVENIPNTTRALLYNSGSLDDISERIIPEKVTYFNQVQWAGIIGFATSLHNWQIGGNVKGLWHQLGSHAGYGIGFDFGMYRSMGENNIFGISIRDITTSWVIWESGTVERITPEISIGNMYNFPLLVQKLKVDFMTNLFISTAGRLKSDDFLIGNMGSNLRVGLNIHYSDNFHLRIGRNPITNYSVGVGMNFSFGSIDYAFTPSPLSSNLGTSHYLSLKIQSDVLKSLREKLNE
ncbi:MAG: hypothetical protein H8E82_00775 [Candidatus Marinimicrobia bacterium]|nr:hypothetical protein [Candidatus Neomarinimicrobiota bacterium]